MAKIEKQMIVLKEITEVGVFAVELIKTIREKGDYAALLPALIAAIEGVGEIGTEIKDTKALVSTGFFLGNEILQAFIVEQPALNDAYASSPESPESETE